MVQPKAQLVSRSRELFLQLRLRDREIEELKKQREFLLGIGAKSTANFSCQKDDVPDDESVG